MQNVEADSAVSSYPYALDWYLHLVYHIHVFMRLPIEDKVAESIVRFGCLIMLYHNILYCIALH